MASEVTDACRLAADIMVAVRQAKFPREYAEEAHDEFEAQVLTPMLEAAMRAADNKHAEPSTTPDDMKRAADIVREHFDSDPPDLSRIVAMVEHAQADALASLSAQLAVKDAGDGWRQQGQAEGFAAAISQLRGMSGVKPPASLAPEANMLADMLEQSRIACITPPRADQSPDAEVV